MPAPDEPASAATDLEEHFRAIDAGLLGWFRRRILDPVEAQDLVQDTFLRVTQSARRAEVQHLGGYIFSVARSVLADRRRRRAVRQADGHVSMDGADRPTEDADALTAIIARERLQHVEAVLRQLPERTRAIFILRRLEGMRYNEIATRFGISVSAVEKHMARAVEHLNTSIGDEA